MVNPVIGTAALGETGEYTLHCIFGIPKIARWLFFVQDGHFDDVQIELVDYSFAPLLAIICRDIHTVQQLRSFIRSRRHQTRRSTF
jgi:hypothetical protein